MFVRETVHSATSAQRKPMCWRRCHCDVVSWRISISLIPHPASFPSSLRSMSSTHTDSVHCFRPLMTQVCVTHRHLQPSSSSPSLFFISHSLYLFNFRDYYAAALYLRLVCKWTLLLQWQINAVTHADDSCGSKAFIRVCLCVCLSA